MQNTST